MGRVERCGGCGGEFVPCDGPQHAYMPAHPGCWATMCALEDDRHALVGAGAVSFVMDLVDAYAAQHPANPDRRNRQSVAIHLMSLCAGIEHGLDGAGRRTRIGGWAHRDYPLLQPWPSGYAVTVADVVASPVERRPEVIGRMATATWVAWSAHHDTVRSWLESSWR